MVRKIFFCSEFPLIPRKWWRKEEGEKQLRNVLFFKQRNNGFTYIFQTDFFEVKKLNFLVTLFARLGSFESISQTYSERLVASLGGGPNLEKLESGKMFFF